MEPPIVVYLRARPPYAQRPRPRDGKHGPKHSIDDMFVADQYAYEEIARDKDWDAAPGEQHVIPRHQVVCDKGQGDGVGGEDDEKDDGVDRECPV